MKLSSYLFCLLLFTGIKSTAAIDTLIGRNAMLSPDVKWLTKDVCKTTQTELGKANAIFNWVTTHIAYDLEAAKDPEREPETVSDVLLKQKATSDGYTLLYKTMCQEAGLNSVIIQGYVKDWIFDNGDTLFIPRHSWCAVYIKGNWELIDPVLGAGIITGHTGWLKQQINKISKAGPDYGDKERFVFKYNPKYFMFPPKEFRRTHLPADPLWQLTQSKMSLETFAAGDSAVNAYNANHDDLQQSNTGLLYIAWLDEQDRILDNADRMYDFNPNFVAALAYKENALVSKKIDEHNKQRNKQKLPADLKDRLKKAIDYLKEQKQYLVAYYALLNKKNTAKNRAAMEHFRQVKTGNTQVAAKCVRYIEVAEKKLADISETKKEVAALQSISKIPAAEELKEPNEQVMKRLRDSILACQSRVLSGYERIGYASDSVLLTTQHHKNIEDQLVQSVFETDELITAEANARRQLMDDYDDEVKTYVTLQKGAHRSNEDSLLKFYMAGYDTLNKRYDELLKSYHVVAGIYKACMNNIAAYRSYNSEDRSFLNNISMLSGNYESFIEKYMAMVQNYEAYQRGSRELLAQITNTGKAQLSIVKDMEEAETVRMEKERAYLAEKKSFDEKENNKHQKQIMENLKKLAPALSK